MTPVLENITPVSRRTSIALAEESPVSDTPKAYRSLTENRLASTDLSTPLDLPWDLGDSTPSSFERELQASASQWEGEGDSPGFDRRATDLLTAQSARSRALLISRKMNGDLAREQEERLQIETARVRSLLARVTPEAMRAAGDILEDAQRARELSVKIRERYGV